jgi:hypothetical protein
VRTEARVLRGVLVTVGAVRSSGEAMRSVARHVAVVLAASVVAEVVSGVVGHVTVVVAHNLPWRPRPDEGLSDQLMHIAPAIAPKMNRKVPTRKALPEFPSLFALRPSPRLDQPIKASHSAIGVRLIDALP